MTDIARHTTWGISLNGTANSNIIDGSLQISPALQKALLYAAGDLLPTLGATLTNTPVISFRTHDLDLLDAPELISTNVVIAARAYDDAAGLGTGYVSFAITKGLIVPVSISGSAGQAAELAVNIYPISSDGDTFPIAVGTSSVTLGVHGDAYTVGDLSLGGSAVSGVQSLNLNLGYNIMSNAGENGKPFPTIVYYDKQESSLSATVTQLSAANADRINTGKTGAVIASFRKLVEGGIPSGTYSLTMAKAFIEANSLQGGRPFTTQISAAAIYDGSGSDFLTFASA